VTVTTLLVLIIPSFFVVGLVGCLCNLLSGTTLVEDPNWAIDYFPTKFCPFSNKIFLGKIWKNVVFLVFKISPIFLIFEKEICQIIDIKKLKKNPGTQWIFLNNFFGRFLQQKKWEKFWKMCFKAKLQTWSPLTPKIKPGK
jgi:hypothetical protein